MQFLRFVRSALFCISFAYLIPANAQNIPYPGFKVVDDVNAFRQKYLSTSENIQTVTGVFFQEKELTALVETIESTGKIWYKKGKVRMDYAHPFRYGIIIDGEKMFIKDGEKESQINVRSSKLFQQVNQIMLDCIQGTILDNPHFTTRVFENNASYLLEFKTESRDLKKFFESIILIVEKKDYTPHSIQLNESSGDTTLITFNEKTVNGHVSDEVFTF